MSGTLLVELRATLREEMIHLSADLHNLRADLCRDVREELLRTWNETCATKSEITKHTEEIVHLHADLLKLRADLRLRDMEKSNPRTTAGRQRPMTADDGRRRPTMADNDGQRPTKTDDHKECHISQGQMKDPNCINGKESLRQLTVLQPFEDLNDALPKEHLQPFAISQDEESVTVAMLPGQVHDADNIAPPSCSPLEMTVSEKKTESGLSRSLSRGRSRGLTVSEKKTDSRLSRSLSRGLSRGLSSILSTPSQRFRQKHAGKPRLQNAMGLVPDMEHEWINSSGFSKRVEDVLVHRWFEYFSMSAIFASAVFIGLSSNYRATHLTEDTPTPFRVVDLLFFLYFLIEVCMRVVAFRCQFFSVFGWAWNVFDLLLVSFQFIEELMGFLNLHAATSTALILRMCRILRAIRCVRIMKLTLFTSEFRLLISCIIHCLSSFFWALSFLVLVIFIMGIYVTDSVVTHRIQLDQTSAFDYGLAKYYGSVPQSCLSLFQALTGGLDWNELLVPLNYSAWNVFWFLMYVAFGLLALMNLVTGLFVNTAIERAQTVNDLQRLFQARQMFSALDLDASDCITEDELLSHINTDAVQEFLHNLGMRSDDLHMLFHIIDKDGGGSIDFEEFVNGLIHLSGTAKSVDLLMMNHELRGFFLSYHK